MLKIGTLKQFEEVKNILPLEVRGKVSEIISVLDEYGAERNIDLNDGGYVLFSDSTDSMARIETITGIRENRVEYVESIGTDYLNALFVRNNEYTINLILHKSIAPEKFLSEAMESDTSQ